MQDAIGDIIDYHDRTKHHPERYANGPGGLDWAKQPDPFRRFKGAPAFRLSLAARDDTPPAAALFGAATMTSQPFTLERLSLYLELSLGLSARKEMGSSELVSADEPFQRQPASDGGLRHPARPTRIARWGWCLSLRATASRAGTTSALAARRKAERSRIPCRADLHYLARGVEIWRTGLPLLPA